PTQIFHLSLHDALPIYRIGMVHDAAMGTDWAGWPAKAFQVGPGRYVVPKAWMRKCVHDHQSPVDGWILPLAACDVNDIIRTMILDRKSTRLNSSHQINS